MLAYQGRLGTILTQVGSVNESLFTFSYKSIKVNEVMLGYQGRMGTNSGRFNQLMRIGTT